MIRASTFFRPREEKYFKEWSRTDDGIPELKKNFIHEHRGDIALRLPVIKKFKAICSNSRLQVSRISTILFVLDTTNDIR